MQVFRGHCKDGAGKKTEAPQARSAAQQLASAPGQPGGQAPSARDKQSMGRGLTPGKHTGPLPRPLLGPPPRPMGTPAPWLNGAGSLAQQMAPRPPQAQMPPHLEQQQPGRPLADPQASSPAFFHHGQSALEMPGNQLHPLNAPLGHVGQNGHIGQGVLPGMQQDAQHAAKRLRPDVSMPMLQAGGPGHPPWLPPHMQQPTADPPLNPQQHAQPRPGGLSLHPLHLAAQAEHLEWLPAIHSAQGTVSAALALPGMHTVGPHFPEHPLEQSDGHHRHEQPMQQPHASAGSARRGPKQREILADTNSAAASSKDGRPSNTARGPRRRNKKGRGNRAAQDLGSVSSGMHSGTDTPSQQREGKGGPADGLQPWPPPEAAAAYGGQPIVPGLGSLPDDSAWPHPKVSHLPQCHITQDQAPGSSCRYFDMEASCLGSPSVKAALQLCRRLKHDYDSNAFFPRLDFKCPFTDLEELFDCEGLDVPFRNASALPGRDVRNLLLLFRQLRHRCRPCLPPRPKSLRCLLPWRQMTSQTARASMRTLTPLPSLLGRPQA